jgi:hypothetical protein
VLPKLAVGRRPGPCWVRTASGTAGPRRARAVNIGESASQVRCRSPSRPRPAEQHRIGFEPLSPTAAGLRPLPTRLGSPTTGLTHRPSWYRRRQAGAAAVLTGRAICVPFPARRLRFLTVNHGHSRSSDLQAPYYRYAATRIVRMGSPVRFRRGAPPQTSRPGRVQHPACSVPRGLRTAICQRFASGSPTVVVRTRSEATVLSDLRCCRLRWPCAVGTSSLLDPHIHENERTRGALLSSEDFGSSVGRRGGCHPVYGDNWKGASGRWSVSGCWRKG